MSKELDLKLAGKIERLTNKTFNFDPRVGNGWFSAVYFLKSRDIIAKLFPNNNVVMQFFQRKNAVLCGTDEVIAILKTFATDSKKLEVYSLKDGDLIKPNETVLTISGAYHNFGFLEGIIDGILARRSAIATNVYDVVQATKSAGKNKQVFFMADRNDHFQMQAGDGYSAYIGGVTAQATRAMNEWWGHDGIGTMPHALIQLFKGDIVAACKAYVKLFPDDELMALVDYNNDVIADSLKVAQAFGSKLTAVRVDTSKTMIDQYFLQNSHKLGDFDPRGVCPELIVALRKKLDSHGFQHVKICVSGGFSATKIREFEQMDIPVAIYGIGSALLNTTISFTGDNVMLNGEHEAKQGRKYKPNKRLEKVDMGNDK